VSFGPGPEAPPPAPEPDGAPRLRWLVVLGFVLAVGAMVLGLLIALAPVTVGVVLLTSGRRNAGIAVIATTIALVGIPRAVFILGFDGHAFRSPSSSMEPTLKIGDRFLTVGDDSPERGDIVVFHPPAKALQFGAFRQSPEDVTFVKRVVGLPGDRLRVVDNRIVVNGSPLHEPYVRTSPCTDVCNLRREIVVPPDHYYMVGDNRGESDDSRTWGPVRREDLVGRAFFRYLPLKRFGSL
jgi:signal peptidase I